MPAYNILKPWKEYFYREKAVETEALVVAMMPESKSMDSRVKLTIEYRAAGKMHSKEVMASSLFNTPEVLNSYVDIYYSRVDPDQAFIKVDGDERPRGFVLAMAGALLFIFGLFTILLAIFVV